MSKKRRSGSWDPVADWYAGWVGPRGSRHHIEVAIPELMGLLMPKPGETVLDVGCGTGLAGVAFRSGQGAIEEGRIRLILPMVQPALQPRRRPCQPGERAPLAQLLQPWRRLRKEAKTSACGENGSP